jgi:hypothetical protein
MSNFEVFYTRHVEKLPTSAAAWLLGSRVRIPLRAWMFVSCVSMLCCPVQVEVSETGWSLVQRSPTVCLNTIMQKARGNHCIKKILTDIPSINSSWELLQTNLNDWRQGERWEISEMRTCSALLIFHDLMSLTIWADGYVVNSCSIHALKLTA